ncbi:MAG: T9SS type A sorting domain-containing protein [candidate division Zixibacteria bacterium]|nr:T9SS type A sorting domain-containing protein [candidate division Zixibacteria bacterium]
MMHKRTVYSLLLTSFILVFAFSSALAQSVTFESKNANRCESGVLNITVDPGNLDLNAIEIVFVISSASGGAFFDNLNIVFSTDLSSNPIIDVSGVDNISPDTIRVADLGLTLGAQNISGVTVVGQLEFTINDVCSGEITLDGAVFADASNPLITPSTQFVDAADNSLIPAAVIAGTITVVNETPTIDPISNATLSWTASYSDVATGDDSDLPNGCENLTFSKLAGPAGLSVNASTGVISWNPTSADIGVNEATIQIADVCGATATSSFEICVTNEAPVIASCSTPDRICWGEGLEGSVTASDPDGGPAALLYSLSSFSGPGTVTVNPSTGDWTWQTDEQNEYIGTFELSIVVTDGANTEDPSCSPSNADTCFVEIEVIPTYRVSIEKTENTNFGSLEDVSISLDNGTDPGNPMGGYDLLIQYDASVLSFNSADIGALIDADGWEYFQYRHGQAGNCGSNACPSGMLRVVAIAETNNNLDHPSGFGETPAASSELTVLNFLVTNDYTLECQYVPIRFRWFDCGDNAISSQTGDTLFISNNVYDSDLIGNIANPGASFPTMQGANSSCDVAPDDGNPALERCVDFWNGGISIVCVNDAGNRGDINLNNLSNEVADAVLFSNYFVYGIVVFTIDPPAQIAATDVNADGTVLSVADLVYLIRIVIGDAQPLPKFTPTEVAVRYTHDINGVMSIKDDVQIGAAHIVISGEVTPILLADEMEIQYAFDGTNTRVLVWSVEGNSFTGDFLNVTGDVVSLEMATYEGHPVSLEVLPTEYALNQNYPNPFNPSTVISFSLPTKSDYTLTIFNVNGQKVAAFDGSAEAGEHEVVWEAGTVHASGIYFYRLVAENGSDRYVDTKKMVLLK